MTTHDKVERAALLVLFWITIAAAVFMFGALLTGCKATHFEITRPDGTRIVAVDTRLLLNTAGKVSFEPLTNGTYRVTVDATSRGDTEAFRAFGEGLGAGMRGAK